MRRKEIDPDMVRQLSMIGCTIARIAEPGIGYCVMLWTFLGDSLTVR